MKEAAEKVGGVGGGHSMAAGAKIPVAKRDEFTAAVRREGRRLKLTIELAMSAVRPEEAVSLQSATLSPDNKSVPKDQKFSQDRRQGALIH